MAWLKVITLLEFSVLMGMIDSLPSAAPRVCNQGESRSTEIRTKRQNKYAPQRNTSKEQNKVLFLKQGVYC